MSTLRPLRSCRWLYLCLLAVSLFWLLLDQTGVLRPVANLALDARFKARGPIEAPVNLVYVDIDTAAITQHGNFPWDRAIFARACELLLTRAGARAVGIDVVFSEAGVPNIADRARVARGHHLFGRYLIHGIPPYDYAPLERRSPPNVVLAASYASGSQRDLATGEMKLREIPLVGRRNSEDPPETPEWDFGGVIFSPPLVGLIDVKEGDTRRVPLYAPTPGRDYLHLSLELARLHYGLAREDVKIHPDRIDLISPSAGLLRSIPLSESQFLEINWFSPWRDDVRNRRVSIGAIYELAEQAAAAQAAGDAKTLAEIDENFADGYFKDAIVLIGPVDPLLQDLAPTSFDHVPVPKVGVHGNLVKTIVSGRFLRPTPDWALPVITIGLTMLVAGLFLGFEGRRSGAARVFAVVALVGYVAAAFLLFAWADWVVPLVVPVGSALSAALVGGAVQLVLEQRQKSRIKGLFGAYLAPAVVDQMVDSGREPTLGGVDEMITAYFSDVQNFSTFSEVLSPPQLVELMNEYLTACTDIVQAEGGTLDKYIGDAVVAMYGAPLALPGHAYHACVAALRVQRRCAELRAKWRHEAAEKNWPDIVLRLQTRIGLNTGRAVVGNMGSASRFSYTMMGDTVNLAARMESGCKSWGVFGMCAEPTVHDCRAVNPERVVFRSLGRTIVKGRATAVPIFELVGLKEEVSDRTRDAIASFEAGLARYYQQDWDGALAHFAQSAKNELNQPDPLAGVATNPSLVYQRLVAELRAHPPGPNWDGAYVMREK